MTRAVARFGDNEIPHCSPMVRAKGSPNVFCNRLSVSVVGTPNTPHTFPAGKTCPGHKDVIKAGGPTVYVNGLGIGHIGDPTCTSVAKGSPNVFAN
jgi:uncharacterized Zn-binding protein involved in type VI secretion